MKRLSVCIAFVFSSVCAFAQTGAIQGFCTQGAVPAVTSGSSSANTLQGVIAGCTVTVYLHGTTTLATIYKDGNDTPLANPFTANLAGATNAGGWIFYAATSQGMDIFGSGGGGNPSCTTQPKCYAVSTPLAVAVYPSTAITIVTGVLTAQGASPVEVNGASGTPVSGAVTISCPTCTTGGVTTVTGILPVASSGGATPAISMHVADASDNGYLSSADWSTFNGKQAALNLLMGTYVDGDICTYASSGTLLNCNTSPSGAAYYQTVQANGSSKPQEAKLNLLSGTNATVACADNSGASSTDCTVSATGGGGGGGNIPSNAIFVFVGTSMNFDDNHVLSTAVTLTGWSTTGGVTTVTNSGTNNFVSGEWVDMAAATSWPVNGAYVSGTATRIFQVLSSGLSSTQFEINTSGVSAGSCASTCGSAYSASAYLPYATTAGGGMPSAAPGNTYAYCSVSDPNSNACTLYGIATNYTNMLHSISPAVTGIPGYLIINGPNDDLGLNYTLTNIETYYQTIFSDAHADGWVIVVGSPTGANFNQNSATHAFAYQVSLDTWLRAQGKQTVQAASAGSSEYWDIWSDVGSVDWDGGDTSIIATNTGLGPTGAQLASVTLDSDIQTANGTVKPRRQLWWAGPVSGGTTGNNGYVLIPSNTPTATWRWMSPGLTTTYAELSTETFSAPEIEAGSINAGNCPGARPFCTSGGFNIDSSNNLYAVAGLNEASGGSNSNCWNTNGGTTACGSSGGLNGTVTYTSNQSASTGDAGKLVIMNCSGACAYTLPTSQPSTTWNAWVMSIGSTTATIVLGGSDTFNGSTSVPVLNQFRTLNVWANSATSTDYEGDAPLVAGSNVTFTPASNGLSVAAPSAGGTYYQTVQANGSSQTQEPKLNLKSGTNATVSCANNSGASSTDCTVSASGGGGSAAYVSGYAYVSSSSSAASVTTSSITVASGDLLYAYCNGAYVSGVTGYTFTDSGSNTWHNAAFESASGYGTGQGAYSTVTNAGSITVTCTPTANVSNMQGILLDITNVTATYVNSAGTSTASANQFNASFSIAPSGRNIGILCLQPLASGVILEDVKIQGFPSQIAGASGGGFTAAAGAYCAVAFMPAGQPKLSATAFLNGFTSEAYIAIMADFTY